MSGHGEQKPLTSHRRTKVQSVKSGMVITASERLMKLISVFKTYFQQFIRPPPRKASARLSLMVMVMRYSDW
jgi:hypothetical protein